MILLYAEAETIIEGGHLFKIVGTHRTYWSRKRGFAIFERKVTWSGGPWGDPEGDKLDEAITEWAPFREDRRVLVIANRHHATRAAVNDAHTLIRGLHNRAPNFPRGLIPKERP